MAGLVSEYDQRNAVKAFNGQASVTAQLDKCRAWLLDVARAMGIVPEEAVRRWGTPPDRASSAMRDET